MADPKVLLIYKYLIFNNLINQVFFASTNENCLSDLLFCHFSLHLWDAVIIKNRHQKLRWSRAYLTLHHKPSIPSTPKKIFTSSLWSLLFFQYLRYLHIAHSLSNVSPHRISNFFICQLLDDGTDCETRHHLFKGACFIVVTVPLLKMNELFCCKKGERGSCLLCT